MNPNFNPDKNSNQPPSPSIPAYNSSSTSGGIKKAPPLPKFGCNQPSSSTKSAATKTNSQQEQGSTTNNNNTNSNKEQLQKKLNSFLTEVSSSSTVHETISLTSASTKDNNSNISDPKPNLATKKLSLASMNSKLNNMLNSKKINLNKVNLNNSSSTTLAASGSGDISKSITSNISASVSPTVSNSQHIVKANSDHQPLPSSTSTSTSSASCMVEYNFQTPNNYDQVKHLYADKLKQLDDFSDDQYDEQVEQKKGQLNDLWNQNQYRDRNQCHFQQENSQHNSLNPLNFSHNQKSTATTEYGDIALGKKVLSQNQKQQQYGDDPSINDAQYEPVQQKQQLALRMMQKYGYRVGQGLGKQSQGIVTPLTITKTTDSSCTIQQSSINLSQLIPPEMAAKNALKAHNVKIDQSSKVIVFVDLLEKVQQLTEQVEADLKQECQIAAAGVRGASSSPGAITNWVVYWMADSFAGSGYRSGQTLQASSIHSPSQLRIFVQFRTSFEAFNVFVRLNNRYYNNRLSSIRFYPSEFLEKMKLSEPVHKHIVS